MGQNKRTIADILKVSISNIIKLLSGVLVGLLLPKIISVVDYGQYKTFTLYATYVGLLTLGFSDGIYLKYGGFKFSDLDKNKFRFFSRFIMILELIISLLIIIVALIFFDNQLRFIFIALAVYLFANNITRYYQIISEITGRFSEYSYRNVIQSILISISVLGLWGYSYIRNYTPTFEIYTLMYVAIILFLTIWYIFTYRNITFGKCEKVEAREIFDLVKLGLPLLISNICLLLILVIDRQFVSIIFDKETYAIYAFAYNMLSLITTALGAISTVLYTTFKRENSEKLLNKYSNLNSVILIMVFLSLVVYFPLCLFVNWVLPKYIDSLLIFRIILPGLALSSPITIVIHNYYKCFGKNNLFFIETLVVLILSVGANFIAYFIFGTTLSISIASVIVLFIWYIIANIYFIKKYKVKWIKNLVYLLILFSAFYLITIISNIYLSFAIYTVVFAIFTFIFYKKQLKSYFEEIIKKGSKKESV